MAYPPTMEEMPGMGNSIEVTVQTMSGRRSSFFMDKFGLIGDVKQRLSKELLIFVVSVVSVFFFIQKMMGSQRIRCVFFFCLENDFAGKNSSLKQVGSKISRDEDSLRRKQPRA